MELEQAIQAVLATGAVSALCATRIYDIQLPQNSGFPACAYQRISAVPLYAHAAPGFTPGLQRVRVTFTCWGDETASSDSVSHAVANAVIADLQDLNAAGGSNRPNQVVNWRTGVEPDTQPPVYKQMIDVMIWFET